MYTRNGHYLFFLTSSHHSTHRILILSCHLLTQITNCLLVAKFGHCFYLKFISQASVKSLSLDSLLYLFIYALSSLISSSSACSLNIYYFSEFYHSHFYHNAYSPCMISSVSTIFITVYQTFSLSFDPYILL